VEEPTTRPRHLLDNIIKMDLGEVGWDDLKGKSLLQDLGMYWIILLKWILEK
jgi:hypothetical protein